MAKCGSNADRRSGVIDILSQANRCFSGECYDCEEDYDEDELFVDLLIDDCGQVVPPQAHSRKVWKSVKEGNALTRLMSTIQEPQAIIAEFVRLDIQLHDMAALNDLDLQYLGIDSSVMRRQMLMEFADFPKQIVRSNKNGPINTLVLSHLFTHLTNIKFSLGPILAHLYDHPVPMVHINDRQYESQRVLQALNEIDASIGRLERQLCDVQFNRTNRRKHTKSAARSSSNLWWWAALTSAASVVGLMLLRASLRSSLRHSERYLLAHLVPTYPRW